MSPATRERIVPYGFRAAFAFPYQPKEVDDYRPQQVKILELNCPLWRSGLLLVPSRSKSPEGSLALMDPFCPRGVHFWMVGMPQSQWPLSPGLPIAFCLVMAM